MNFLRRHIGSSRKQIAEMYKFLGVNSQELINNVIPSNIKSDFQQYPSNTEEKSITDLKNDGQKSYKPP